MHVGCCGLEDTEPEGAVVLRLRWRGASGIIISEVFFRDPPWPRRPISILRIGALERRCATVCDAVLALSPSHLISILFFHLSEYGIQATHILPIAIDYLATDSRNSLSFS